MPGFNVNLENADGDKIVVEAMGNTPEEVRELVATAMNALAEIKAKYRGRMILGSRFRGNDD